MNFGGGRGLGGEGVGELAVLRVCEHSEINRYFCVETKFYDSLRPKRGERGEFLGGVLFPGME